MILDSGKTSAPIYGMGGEFESIVILDSGKTVTLSELFYNKFESIVILDSGKTLVRLYNST